VDFGDVTLRANARQIISGNLADDPSDYGVPPKPDEYEGMFEQAYHLAHEALAAHKRGEGLGGLTEQAKALSNKFARARMQDHEGMGTADARFTIEHTPPPTRAPTTFFHGTASEVVDKILKEGLVPGSGSGGDAWAAEHGMHVQTYTFAGRDQSVYMSTEPETAKAFAKIAAKMHPGSKADQLRGASTARGAARKPKSEVDLDNERLRSHAREIIAGNLADEPQGEPPICPSLARVRRGH
jgi:hypothetical protein